jgi:competence protein ComEC
LEKQLLLRLRTILLYDKLYIILTIGILVYSLIITNIENRKSIYNGKEKQLNGYINNILIDGNKLKIELKAKEIIIANYYIKTHQEKKEIINNYQLGDYIKITGDMLLPKNNTNFNLFNYKRYLNNKNIFYLFKIDTINKMHSNHKITNDIRQYIDNRINNIKYSKYYLKAFILGDDSLINNNIKQSYQINGISHLLAISGAQISLFAIILLIIFKKIKIEENKRYYLTILFILFYIYLTNYNSSVIRASIFFILLSINKIYYFNIKTINLLLLTLIIILLLNPYYLYDIGFQLSYIISLYLILFQHLIKKYNNYFIKLLIISMIAFLASMPIIIYNFYQINLLSPIINLLFVPLVSFIIFPLSLITFIIPILDYPLYLFIKLMEYLSLNISNIDIFNLILAKPHIIIIIIYYLIITYILYNLKSTIILLLIIIIHHNIIYLNNIPKLIMIDVNQGDSFLIILPHNKGNILIDTGGKKEYNKPKWQQPINNYNITKNTLIPLFKSHGIKEIDYLILTHGDEDHMGEIFNVINNFKVNRIILNSGIKTNIESKLINEYKNIEFFDEDTLIINKYKFYFINNANKDNINNNSLVIYTNINNHKILFTGDITTKEEQEIINKYNINNIDILKIAHHGSITSTSSTFLNVLNPKYALISVGLNNHYNHPNKTIINRLHQKKIKTYLTSVDGSIKLNLMSNNIIIEKCKP